MTSERSLYAKIRLVLDDADRRSPAEGPLADVVLARRHPSFLTLQYDLDSDDYVSKPSRRAVLRAVAMAGRLGLLTDEGTLTHSGERAARNERSFLREMSLSLRDVLMRGGVTPQRLQESSRRLLRKSPAVLPTGRALWEAVECDLSKGDFNQLLALLADVGGATTEQRKVYMKFEVL